MARQPRNDIVGSSVKPPPPPPPKPVDYAELKRLGRPLPAPIPPPGYGR